MDSNKTLPAARLRARKQYAAAFAAADVEEDIGDDDEINMLNNGPRGSQQATVYTGEPETPADHGRGPNNGGRGRGCCIALIVLGVVLGLGAVAGVVVGLIYGLKEGKGNSGGSSSGGGGGGAGADGEGQQKMLLHKIKASRDEIFLSKDLGEISPRD